MSDLATLYIDGASRGNPGPAAYAVVLARPGLPEEEEADVIGPATNNFAEYTALIKGLSLAAERGVTRLEVRSDSELLVKQMRGEYRVRHPELRELWEQARRLAEGFEQFRITHVRREENRRADRLANEALDGRPRKPGSVPSELEPAPVGTVPIGAAAEGHPSDMPVAEPPPALREQALAVLGAAARTWTERGLEALPVESVWEQLWSVLAGGGVVRPAVPVSGS